MAQKQESAENEKWKSGQKCKVYDRFRNRWVDGEIVEVIDDENGEFINVQYGKMNRCIHVNDPDLRPIEGKKGTDDAKREKAIMSREAKVTAAVDEFYAKINLMKPILKDIIANTHDLKKFAVKDALTWYNVMQCVRHELYPAMAISLSQAVDELVYKSGFAVGDLSEEAVNRVIEVLKTKKVLFSNEIEYIQDLVGRARAFEWDQNEGMLCLYLILVPFSDGFSHILAFHLQGKLASHKLGNPL